jgi:hypothetical protein
MRRWSRKDSPNKQIGVEVYNAFMTALVATISANRGHDAWLTPWGDQQGEKAVREASEPRNR